MARRAPSPRDTSGPAPLRGADLAITFTPRADGGVVFRATRADGSATWQRHEGVRASFFPHHDLTHYAVETVLGARDGFYGLLAAGWDVADTGGKGARGPLPAEAVIVEHIVGMLDTARAGGAPPLAATELAEQLATLRASGRIASVPALTDAQLDDVHRRAGELQDAWARCAARGEVFSLDFTRPAASRLLPP